jgi:hypothetical protein
MFGCDNDYNILNKGHIFINLVQVVWISIDLETPAPQKDPYDWDPHLELFFLLLAEC